MRSGLNVFAAIYHTIGHHTKKDTHKKKTDHNLVYSKDVQNLETNLSVAFNPSNQSAQMQPVLEQPQTLQLPGDASDSTKQMPAFDYGGGRNSSGSTAQCSPQ